jgi:ribosomal-protein-alanine N-acetyltransferase
MRQRDAPGARNRSTRTARARTSPMSPEDCPRCDDGVVSRKEVLRTDQLVLTSWLPADVDRLAEIHSDEETMRFVREGRPETRLETTALIDQYIAEDAQFGVTKWRLVDHHDQLVGRAGFGPHRDGRELGYTIRRQLWGQGMATEIATGLVAWHRVYANGIPLWAYVAIGNPASYRVLEKSGFDHVGSEQHHEATCELFRLPET